jgi:multidrug efflux pump subunit AcrB
LSSLWRNTLIALVVIYALIVVPFRSYLTPLIFLLAAPVAWCGGVLAHWLTGLPLSIESLVGMIAASGVVVNDSLVLLDYIKERGARGRRLEAGGQEEDGRVCCAHQAETARAACPTVLPAEGRTSGLPLEVSGTENAPMASTSSLQPQVSSLILEACTVRFCPILLAFLTTFVGFLPTLFETSAQAQFLIPMTLSLTAGLLFGMVASLVLTPVCYAVFAGRIDAARIETSKNHAVS